MSLKVTDLHFGIAWKGTREKNKEQTTADVAFQGEKMLQLQIFLVVFQ